MGSGYFRRRHSMTTVWISHNPFLVETEIIIDDVPIAETSRLYKYIKTPMQNWVGSFLPALVEHCNDDELDITFKGLPHNCEDLKFELRSFLEKNRDYEIGLHCDVCQSPLERLKILDDITKKLPDPAESPRTVLKLLVFGGDPEQRKMQMEQLSQETFEVDCYCPLEIHDTEPEALEQAIHAQDKPILICLLDENTGSKQNARIMNLISDAYKVRGRFNKWRFLFVADNPQYARRLLSSDFSIKNADVYASDDFVSIRRRIEEYQNEVCLVGCAAEASEKMVSQLSALKETLGMPSEQTKKLEEIDDLERKALDIVDACTCFAGSSASAESSIDSYLDKLRDVFSDYCWFRPDASAEYKRNLSEEKAIARVKFFIHNMLENAIENHLDHLAQTSGYAIRLNIDKARTNCDTETAADVLKQFGCDSLRDYIHEYALGKHVPISPTCSPATKTYLSKITKTFISVHRFSFRYEVEYISFSRRFPGRSTGSGSNTQITYSFYDGLFALVCRNLQPGQSTSISPDKKKQCVETFREQITLIKPVLSAHLSKCKALAEAESEKIKAKIDESREQARQSIKAQADIMRKNAQLSAEQAAQLELVGALLEQAEAITRL